jgi:transposase
VKHVVAQYLGAETIHLVMDNLNSHTRQSLVKCFGEEQGGDLWKRLTVHYTPKHGIWLNQAEIELSLVSRQCLGKMRFPDLGTLQREVKAWNRKTNQKRTKVNWQFTRKKARKLFRYKKPRASG